MLIVAVVVAIAVAVVVPVGRNVERMDLNGGMGEYGLERKRKKKDERAKEMARMEGQGATEERKTKKKTASEDMGKRMGATKSRNAGGGGSRCWSVRKEQPRV